MPFLVLGMPYPGMTGRLGLGVAWYVAHRSWWEPIKSGEYRSYYEQQYAARLSG